MKTKYNKRQLKTVAKNTRILQATMATLKSLTNTVHLKEMAMDSIQLHLLDEDGDGLVLCLEYDENGELQKTFSSVDEFYEDTIEVELEDSDEEHEEVESFIEEAISEEYDEVLSEVFHSNESKPPLLN